MKQMLLHEIPVNYSAPSADRIRLTKQERIIYQKLLDCHFPFGGMFSNVEMHNLTGSLNVSARISNIRKFLKPFGWTVKIIKSCGGVNYYKIVEVEE